MIETIPVGSTLFHNFYGIKMKKIQDSGDPSIDSYWEGGLQKMYIPDVRVRSRIAQNNGILSKLVEVHNG